MLQHRNLDKIRSNLKGTLFPTLKSKENKLDVAIQSTSTPNATNHEVQDFSSPRKSYVSTTPQQFDEVYSIGEKLGEGAHAIVRVCYKRASKSPLNAVKIFRTGDPEIVNTIKQTFNIQRSLSEIPQIAKALELFIDDRTESHYFVMEYCDFPSLERVMKKLNENAIQKLMESLANVIEAIHQKGISHRDLKPDNILVNLAKMEVKLIDFGVSKKFLLKNIKSKQKMTDMWTRTGTILYSAPEIFQGGGYDAKVDIWSCGVILFQLLCGRLPYCMDTLSDTIESICDMEDTIENMECYKKLNYLQQDILRRLLKKEPEKRLNAHEFKLHPWLQNNCHLITQSQDDMDISPSELDYMNTQRTKSQQMDYGYMSMGANNSQYNDEGSWQDPIHYVPSDTSFFSLKKIQYFQQQRGGTQFELEGSPKKYSNRKLSFNGL